jgi:hypothetical protein
MPRIQASERQTASAVHRSGGGLAFQGQLYAAFANKPKAIGIKDGQHWRNVACQPRKRHCEKSPNKTWREIGQQNPIHEVIRMSAIR